MTIRVNLLCPKMVRVEGQILGSQLLREKPSLMQSLQGGRLSTVEAVAEAETAFARLRDKHLIWPSDFTEVLRLAAESPEDRWSQYYIATEGGGGYAGPFGNVYDGDRDAAAEYARIRQREEEAAAVVGVRRGKLIEKIRLFVYRHPRTTVSFILRHFTCDPEAVARIIEQFDALNPQEDFLYIVRSAEDQKLRLLVAKDRRTSRELLLELLRGENKAVAAAAADNLRQRRLANLYEIYAVRIEKADPQTRAALIESWPAEAPFLPDRYSALFPLRLSGYQSEPLARVSNRQELDRALSEIKRNNDGYDEWERRWSDSPVGVAMSFNSSYLVSLLNPQLERELVLLSHQLDSFGKAESESHAPTPQQLLSGMRARIAFNILERKPKPDYHDLAFLYYALRYGDATLGGVGILRPWRRCSEI